MQRLGEEFESISQPAEGLTKALSDLSGSCLSGKEQNSTRRAHLLYLQRQFKPIHAGHENVTEQKIRAVLRGLGNGLAA